MSPPVDLLFQLSINIFFIFFLFFFWQHQKKIKQKLAIFFYTKLCCYPTQTNYLHPLHFDEFLFDYRYNLVKKRKKKKTQTLRHLGVQSHPDQLLVCVSKLSGRLCSSRGRQIGWLVSRRIVDCFTVSLHTPNGRQFACH